MKATAIRDDMKKKLTQTLNEDVDSFAKRGEGKGLSPDLQKYYGTDKLSYESCRQPVGHRSRADMAGKPAIRPSILSGDQQLWGMTNESIQSRLNDLAQKSELSTKDKKSSTRRRAKPRCKSSRSVRLIRPRRCRRSPMCAALLRMRSKIRMIPTRLRLTPTRSCGRSGLSAYRMRRQRRSPTNRRARWERHP